MVLINIFLAILVEAFSAVKESAQSSETLIEGLSEVAMHDIQYAQSLLPSACVGNRARFISDGKLRLLLEAWHATEADRTGSESSDVSVRADGDGFGGAGDDENGPAPVIHLSDGSEIGIVQLSLLLLALLSDAPSKIDNYRKKSSVIG